MTFKEIGKAVRLARNKTGKNQTITANNCGVSRRSYQDIELGKPTNRKALNKVAIGLNISFDLSFPLK